MWNAENSKKIMNILREIRGETESINKSLMLLLKNRRKELLDIKMTGKKKRNKSLEIN